MKKHLILTDTRSMTPEQWLRFRNRGVGASDVGTVMGLNPYKSSIQLFYEKISADLPFNIENIAMFMGKELEDKVANFWQYWEGSEESLIKNFRERNILRRCQRVNAYVQNPKYPWLFVSLDRKINRHEGRDEGALECKTISGWASQMWEAGIPPSHVVQVQTQLTVCEFIYGDLATLTDGRRFDVTPFDFNKQISGAIIESTHDFWGTVEKARVIVTQQFEARRKKNMRLVDELSAQLVELEPAADNTEAYADFLTEKFGKSVAGERSGTIIELAQAEKHKDCSNKITALEDKKRGHENQIKKGMGAIERITFGDRGFISWKTNKTGARVFTNKVA